MRASCLSFHCSGPFCLKYVQNHKWFSRYGVTHIDKDLFDLVTIIIIVPPKLLDVPWLHLDRLLWVWFCCEPKRRAGKHNCQKYFCQVIEILLQLHNSPTFLSSLWMNNAPITSSRSFFVSLSLFFIFFHYFPHFCQPSTSLSSPPQSSLSLHTSSLVMFFSCRDIIFFSSLFLL